MWELIAAGIYEALAPLYPMGPWWAAAWGLALGLVLWSVWAAHHAGHVMRARLALILAVVVAVGPATWWAAGLLHQHLGEEPPAPAHYGWWAGALAVGLVLGWGWTRWAVPALDRLSIRRLLRPSGAVRQARTDARSVSRHLPDTQDYDPRADYRSGAIAIGRNRRGRPLRIDPERWRASHVDIVGTTGSGKNVAAQSLLHQSIQAGEAALIIDPKRDRWTPHVAHQAADEAGVPYVYIDLAAEAGQWSPLAAGADWRQIAERLQAGFSLSERGTDADFYRVGDREGARRLAGWLAGQPAGQRPNPADAYRAVAEDDSYERAAKMLGDLRELAELPSCNPAPGAGVSIEDTLAAGGVVYVVGGVRDAAILKAQKMVLLEALQWKERESTAAPHTLFFLDEVKYILSQPALQALGTIRDKGGHIMLAHQSKEDLRDLPADLDPEAVEGAIVENTSLKLLYRVMSPTTAEWLASMSGTVLVDDERRTYERTAAGSERSAAHRTVTQAEEYLIDSNQLLYLPPRVAAIYGATATPTLAAMAPVRVQQRAAATTTTGGQDTGADTSAPEPSLAPGRSAAEEALDV